MSLAPDDGHTGLLGKDGDKPGSLTARLPSAMASRKAPGEPAALDRGAGVLGPSDRTLPKRALVGSLIPVWNVGIDEESMAAPVTVNFFM